MKLTISPDLALPIDAATQTIAILARKRVGKTYTASVIAEELIEAKIPIVVLDPTGAWWGLRSLADGKGEGYPVIIIGGSHADVPLEETAGKVIADLVVDHPGYYIIDFSQIEVDAAIQRFSTDFSKRFYFRKEQKRFAMQLIIDEADIFIPQNPFGEEKRMLHAFDVIVRRGGIRGIGCIMISQRPAVLNKNVLTQCETLIALQISGSQDVDAIEHWMRVHGTKEQKAEFLSTIGSLQMGVAWFWSPSWLQRFEQIHIRKRITFNSSATPKAGEIIVMPTKLAHVDIAALGEQIRATAANAKANDPAELKKQISKLRQELSVIQKQKPETVKTQTKELHVLVDTELHHIKLALKSFGEARQAISKAEPIMQRIEKEIAAFTELVGKNKNRWTVAGTQRKEVFPTAMQQFTRPLNTPLIRRHKPEPETNGEISIGKCERSILTALAQYPEGRMAVQVAILTGYSSGSGGFNNSLSKLRSSGLITRGNPIQITQDGLKELGDYSPLPQGDDLKRNWLGKLAKCEREILNYLLQIHPNAQTAHDVAEATGYTASSGGFNNSLSRLRTLELITRGQPMKASDDFFQ